MTSNIQQLSAPLRRFFAELGDGAPDPADHEELTLLRVFVQDLPGAAAANLRFDTWAALADAYGAALRLTFRLGDLPLLELRDGATPDTAALARFQDEARGLPTLTMDLRLDKPALLRQMLTDEAADTRAWLFLLADTLRRYLMSARLPDLDHLLAPADAEQPANRLLLLTPETDIWLDGPLLTVAGGIHAARRHETVPGRSTSAQAANCYRAAQKELRWESRWLRRLTPYHLAVESSEFDNTLEAQAIRAHLLNAILLYLADRTVAGPDGLVSTFAGSTQSAAVRHVAAAEGENLPAEQVRRLFALFDWTYAPEWADGERLSLTQIEIVRALSSAGPELRAASLVEDAGRILDELRWGWKELLEQRVAEYIGQVQQVEGFVSETVSAYAEQVNGIVKSLSDTMLAAVAVVLASFVGALLQTPFDATVVRIGLLTYAGYVLAFPLLYNMGNQWGRHKALERDFAYRRSRHEQRLLPERVRQIIGDEVTVSRERFQRWYWVTVALYVLVIVAAVAAALLAPGLIASATP